MKRLVISMLAGVVALAACTSGNGGGSPSGAPTGSTIVFERGPVHLSRLFAISPDGTHQQLIRATSDRARLSPDGSRFMDTEGSLTHHSRTVIFNADGSGVKVQPTPDPAFGFGISGAWSPDGTHVVSDTFGCHTPQCNRQSLSWGMFSRRSSDGLDLLRVTDPGKNYDRPFPGSYSPDGSKILFVRTQPPGSREDVPMNLFVVNPDGTGLLQLNPDGATVVLSDYPASWSPDGRKVAFASFTSKGSAVFLVDADGSELHRITPWAQGGQSADWSPDGRWIAFIAPQDAYCCNWQVWVVHPDGTGLKAITSAADGSYSYSPVWSPDSSKLLFVHGDDPDPDLWTVNVDGTGLFQLTHDPGSYSSIAWVPHLETGS